MAYEQERRVAIDAVVEAARLCRSVQAALVSEVRAKAWPWLYDGRLQPVIHQVFSFAEAGEAHRVMEASTHIGKLILSWE